MDDETRQEVLKIVQQAMGKSQFGQPKVPYHTHNNIDSPQLDYNLLKNLPTTSTSTVPIYSGQVSSNAAGSFFPAGWTLNHAGTGSYTLTHNLGDTNYAIVVTSVSSNIYVAVTLGTNSVDIETFDASSGSNTNADFVFILTTQANP